MSKQFVIKNEVVEKFDENFQKILHLVIGSN
jgi:hypothetical protein